MMPIFEFVRSGSLRSSRCKTVLTAAVIALALVFAGCEEDVNPFIGTDFPFTVWGFVNPKADTQAVRVFTIDDVLKLIPADPLDATVTVINVDADQRFVLKDSTIAIPGGDFRHVFWSDFDVEYGSSYRIEVERSDGFMTRSTIIQAPQPISISILEPNLNAVSELLLPLEIEGNPPNMPRIEATYFAYSASPEGARIQDNFVSIPYTGKPLFRNGVWALSLDLRDDFLAVRSDFTDKDISGFICLDAIKLDIHVTNVEWSSPIGEFDRDFLVEPGVLTNMENGFGLFGAGYLESISWAPPGVMQVRAGFFDCIGR